MENIVIVSYGFWQRLIEAGNSPALLIDSGLRNHPDPEGVLPAFLVTSFRDGAICAGWKNRDDALLQLHNDAQRRDGSATGVAQQFA
ncbi:hypothetical protein D770_17145 [Flammeovirgaceae bacterium 311]|nr:hypothetical protein D770_17145 [Flammeovirgaceae bacterium 311]